MAFFFEKAVCPHVREREKEGGKVYEESQQKESASDRDSLRKRA